MQIFWALVWGYKTKSAKRHYFWFLLLQWENYLFIYFMMWSLKTIINPFRHCQRFLVIINCNNFNMDFCYFGKWCCIAKSTARAWFCVLCVDSLFGSALVSNFSTVTCRAVCYLQVRCLEYCFVDDFFFTIILSLWILLGRVANGMAHVECFGFSNAETIDLRSKMNVANHESRLNPELVRLELRSRLATASHGTWC